MSRSIPNDQSDPADDSHHHIIALVQVGWLVGTFDAEKIQDAERAAKSLSVAGGHHVDLYDVTPNANPLPQLGTDVKPHELGWTPLHLESA